MFGFQRRLVRRWECDTDLPNEGFLPQTSHTLATGNSWKVETDAAVDNLTSLTRPEYDVKRTRGQVRHICRAVCYQQTQNQTAAEGAGLPGRKDQR